MSKKNKKKHNLKFLLDERRFKKGNNCPSTNLPAQRSVVECGSECGGGEDKGDESCGFQERILFYFLV